MYLFKYLFLFLLFLLPIQADAVWFNSSWTYKVKVEVNPNKVGTTTAVTSFPVYNDCGGFPATFWTNASSTGADIRVVESDNTTETAFELVSFSTTSKTCELHFMGDSLATTSTSTFYVYYGNATATAYAVTDTYGRNAVWSNYVAVYHLKDANGYTSGGYNLTNNNTATFTADGIAGKSLTLGSANTNKSVSYNTDEMGMTSSSNFTATFWFFAETLPTSGQFQTIFTRNFNGNSANGSQIRVGYENAGGTRRLRFFRLGGTNVFLDKNIELTTSVWNYGAFTYNGSTIRAYHNGSEYANNSNTGTQVISGTRFTIGTNTVGANDPFKGNIDEFRIASSTFSNSWITTEYNNQSSPSTFFYIGAEESDTPATTSSDSGIIWFD